MNFNIELINTNNYFSSSGVKLRIEKRGNRLSLRGPLPCQEALEKLKTQRISLGLPSTIEGLEKAKELVKLISLQIEHQQFNWDNWVTKRQPKSLVDNDLRLDEQIDKFKSGFFEKPRTRGIYSSNKSNWNYAYKPYLRRLQAVANNSDCSINKELLLETLSTYPEKTRSRQQCGTVLHALASYLDIQLPEDWRKRSYGYGLHKARFRELPSDEKILKSSELIPNIQWKLVYGLMATYGLRNHEVFFCDLSCLREDGDSILRVFPNTKTGEHQVWPFHPEWVKFFNLKLLAETENELPKVQTDLSLTSLQQVGRRVSEQFRRYKLPLTPYDLRHAWAIRTIHIGLPDTVSARMMGHSVAIHTRTYHHWITKRDQQRAVDDALGKITA